MAPQTVRWAYRARADLPEALEYLAEESFQAASSFLDQVEEGCCLVVRVPVVGHYRLIYRVESGSVATTIGAAAPPPMMMTVAGRWRARSTARKESFDLCSDEVPHAAARTCFWKAVAKLSSFAHERPTQPFADHVV